MIRDQPFYRRAAFEKGLKACGYELFNLSNIAIAKPDEVLVIWNRYGTTHDIATAFEEKGGKVIVAENGYIGEGGSSCKFDVHPKGPKPGDYYALALHHHNGGGSWLSGGDERLAKLRLDLKPLTERKGYGLICANRSFGIPGRTMPADWPQRTRKQLETLSGAEIRVRLHPGNNEPAHSLAEDLAGAEFVVVWSSSSGVHALIDGIPVICDAPYWIAKRAAFSVFSELDQLRSMAGRLAWESSREDALRRLSWAQWTVDEIASGAAFKWLL